MQALSDERKAIETRIDELLEQLKTHGVDRKTPLKSADGFPRADLDVYAITHIKAELVSLENDFKTVQKKIEEFVFNALRKPE